MSGGFNLNTALQNALDKKLVVVDNEGFLRTGRGAKIDGNLLRKIQEKTNKLFAFILKTEETDVLGQAHSRWDKNGCFVIVGIGDGYSVAIDSADRFRQTDKGAIATKTWFRVE